MNSKGKNAAALMCAIFAVSGNCFGAELVVHYGFNGNVLDMSGNGNDGTISGNPSFVPGQIGQAMDFENPAGQVATTQFVTLPNSPSITDLATGSFSFALLYKSTDTTQNNGRLFGNLAISTQGLGYTYNAATTPTSYVVVTGSTGTASTEFNSGGLTTDGNWHWGIIVFDRSANVLDEYVDNNLVATANISNVGSVSFSNLEIGAIANEPTFGARLTAVDDFQLYDFALSPNNVNTLVTTGIVPVPEPSSLAVLGCSGMMLIRRRRSRERSAII